MTTEKPTPYWRGQPMRRATIDEMAQATPRETLLGMLPTFVGMWDVWRHRDHIYAVDKDGNFWTSAPA